MSRDRNEILEAARDALERAELDESCQFVFAVVNDMGEYNNCQVASAANAQALIEASGSIVESIYDSLLNAGAPRYVADGVVDEIVKRATSNRLTVDIAITKQQKIDTSELMKQVIVALDELDNESLEGIQKELEQLAEMGPEKAEPIVKQLMESLGLI